MTNIDLIIVSLLLVNIVLATILITLFIQIKNLLNNCFGLDWAYEFNKENEEEDEDDFYSSYESYFN